MDYNSKQVLQGISVSYGNSSDLLDGVAAESNSDKHNAFCGLMAVIQTSPKSPGAFPLT